MGCSENRTYIGLNMVWVFTDTSGLAKINFLPCCITLAQTRSTQVSVLKFLILATRLHERPNAAPTSSYLKP